MSLALAPERCDTGSAAPAAAPALSVVVPCHNEADSLPQLAAALGRLHEKLEGTVQIEILLVDDGSTDATWQAMHECFRGQGDVRILRHAERRGIAAAIATGLRAARSEIVASIDADCTYEPAQLVTMLPLLTSEVAVVVASPYHPAGKVHGVPAWRLRLSRVASGLYRAVMRNKLHTYTSCFRLYRKSEVLPLVLRHDGFVGVVELLWRVDQNGGTIVECPAVLTARAFGQSKMRVLKIAFAHVGLLARAAIARVLSFPLRSSNPRLHSPCPP